MTATLQHHHEQPPAPPSPSPSNSNSHDATLAEKKPATTTTTKNPLPPPPPLQHQPPARGKPEESEQEEEEEHPIASIVAAFGRKYAALMSHPTVGPLARSTLSTASEVFATTISLRRYVAIEFNRWAPVAGFIVLPPEDESTKTLSTSQLSDLAHADFGPDEYVMLYFHAGGGYAFGTPFQCYPLAPDNPFPVALETAVAVYQQLTVIRNASPDRLILMGDSAGVGLALALAQYLQYPSPSPAPTTNATVSTNPTPAPPSQPQPPAPQAAPAPTPAADAAEPVAALVMFSPWIELSTAAPSFAENARSDYIPRDAVDHFARMYTGFAASTTTTTTTTTTATTTPPDQQQQQKPMNQPPTEPPAQSAKRAAAAAAAAARAAAALPRLPPAAAPPPRGTATSHAALAAHPLLSALRAPRAALAGLVRAHARTKRRPALVAVGGREVFRDDVLAFAGRLGEAGVSVHTVVEPEAFHCWVLMRTPAAWRTMRRVAAFLAEEVML
ncbi:Alpha/Beta hydrolase protein [Zopfochytrium polystomum]|nr:Alpha/Beta hydrolase protein [Zopfochytrium polystomum]